MSNVISHTGIVDGIAEGVVCVRIVQSSACGSCKVASYCNSAESKEKIVEVRCADASSYTVGQDVMVIAEPSVGMKAVTIAFVVPVITILAVVVIVLTAGGSEFMAAIAGLAVLVPYYAVLYAMRKHLERVLTFRINKN